MTKATGCRNEKNQWGEMPFTEEEWSSTPQAVQAFVLSLLGRLEELEEEVKGLKEQVNRTSRNSSKPPSSDGPEVEREKKEEGERKQGGQKGHKGSHRELVPIEEVDEVHEVKPTECRECGHGLSGEDAEPYRHQVTEVPPVVARVEEYRLHILSCAKCGKKTRAKLPQGVPTGAFGPRLQAMVTLLTGQYHLSKRESCQVMTDFFQAKLSLGSVSKLEQRTSQALEAPVDQVRQAIQQQTVINIDETGWYQAHKRAWLWVATTPQLSAFLIRPSRGSQVAKELLGQQFLGIVGSDRWSAYNWLATNQRQLCWAHLLRDFQAFVDRGGQSRTLGNSLLAQMRLMFDAWHLLKHGESDRIAFQDTMQPIRQQVGTLLRQGTSCDHSKTAGTCRDILKREAALWTFVDSPHVEPTNNLAERQVRPAVIWRKHCFGTQSDAGSRFVERILSAVATLKLQQRNVLDYLTLACHAFNSGQPPPSLLPP